MKNTKENPEVGVIVARLQSPHLHNGHVDVITQVLENHPRVIIFLGVSRLKFTKKNPYDFAIRRAMVEERFPDIEVYPIDDVGNDDVWSKNLDAGIDKAIGPQLKVVLYGGRDSFIKHYTGKYPTLELIPKVYISASDIRKQTGIKPKFNQGFREGMVYVLQNQFTSCKATVDMAIVDFKNQRFLFGRKPGRPLLCFVGGFSDTNNTSYEDDGIREVKEETTLDVTDPQYIGSTLIDDERYRDEDDKIKTLLFMAEYKGGEPVASDDLDGGEVRWVGFNELKEEMLNPNHRILVRMLLAYMKKRYAKYFNDYETDKQQ
jgi:bifunctional NMN adenylyltransferase/nudix hydrolase